MVRHRLLDTHGLPLPAEDLRSIEYALKAFYLDGPGIHYARLLPKDAPGPSYRALMTASDARGVARSYLATEDAFAFVKNLHTRNLIVPIVGDFSGPSAMKSVGDYARQRGSVVSAFYSSNVEVYLTNQQMTVFCANLAALPYESGHLVHRQQGPAAVDVEAQDLCARIEAVGVGRAGELPPPPWLSRLSRRKGASSRCGVSVLRLHAQISIGDGARHAPEQAGQHALKVQPERGARSSCNRLNRMMTVHPHPG